MAKEATAPAESVDLVQYVETRTKHHFAIRRITEADWARVGVELGKQVEWSKDNNFRVKKSDLDFLTAEQFDSYINADPDLRVVEE